MPKNDLLEYEIEQKNLWKENCYKYKELARQLSDLVVDLEAAVNMLAACMTVDEGISSQEIAALDMAEEVMAKVRKVRGEK